MTRARVDVGIPTHGRPRYVVEAVESVLAQSFRDWRLLIAEDGEGGGAIADAVAPYLADERVRYKATGTHVGAAAAMTGIIGTGDADYVAILHDDDRWHPGFLDRRVACLDANPACGMAFGEHQDVDENGRVVGRSRARVEAGVQDRGAFARAMLRENLIATPTVVMRRSSLEACGPAYDASYRFLFDWELMLRLAQRFPVCHVGEWDADYRVHGAQISGQRTVSREFLRVFEEGDRRADELDPAMRLPEPERRQRYARLRMSVALEEAVEGRRRDAIGSARRALRADVRVLGTAQFAGTAGTVLLPPAGRRAMDRVRLRRFRGRVGSDEPAA